TFNLTESYNLIKDESLKWNPYRPNCYIGFRANIPHSIILGVMWFNADSIQGFQNIRNFVSMDDKIKKFSWLKFNPRSGGRQIIKDDLLKIDIIVDFIKNKKNLNNWGLKITGVSTSPLHQNSKISIITYIGLESETFDEDRIYKKQIEFDPDDSNTYDMEENPDYLTLSDTKTDINGFEGSIKLNGFTKDFGKFDIEITDYAQMNKHPDFDMTRVTLEERRIYESLGLDSKKNHHLEIVVPNENVWRAKDIFLTMLQESIRDLSEKYRTAINLQSLPACNGLILRDLYDYRGNLHFIQKIYEGDFEYEILFNQRNNDSRITSKNINIKITENLISFDEKFNQKFKLQAPFNKPKYSNFAKEIISSLMGGLSYFHGSQIVDRVTEIDEENFSEVELTNGKLEGPYELLTLVPTRSFFPRGFYWDEGFHLISLIDFDFDLTLEILKSWFNLIDDDGWIAREQILGPESRNFVPKKFQTQNAKIGNPPTLMLLFSEILEKLHELKPHELKGNYSGSINEEITDKQSTDLHLTHPRLLVDYARSIYPKLKKHYYWFRKTQKGETEELEREYPSSEEAYRWVGRTELHCLPSGLDDYPRCENADSTELNIDLMSWVGVMSKAMKEIARLLNYEDDYKKFDENERRIVKNIEEVFWSEESKCYCDIHMNLDDEDELVCHKGYISLFPFLLKLIPVDESTESEKHILSIIKLISDEDELFSEFGIRSLSQKDEYFRTGEDYWRGSIWVNINYLILESVKYYVEKSENSEIKRLGAKLYGELRVNLAMNIYNEWVRTGFVWESYFENDGKGKGANGFTGWSSLVVNIMKMPEEIN
ncbi:mannosyl-oligosaccharide glucosidase, partial [Ascoidea rubescens DSM 1968]